MKIISYNLNGIRSAINKGLLEWLKSGEADLVIMPEHPNIEEEMLDWIPLAEDPMVAVLPKEHPSQKGGNTL